MSEESRGRKVLREVNETYQETSSAVQGMTPAQKKAMWIVAAAVAAIAALFVWVF